MFNKSYVNTIYTKFKLKMGYKMFQNRFPFTRGESSNKIMPILGFKNGKHWVVRKFFIV